MTTLHIRVRPGASATAWKGEMADGSRKLDLAAPAEGGKANAELIRFLAREYGVARSAVAIVAGQSSRRKTVRIDSDQRSVASIHPRKSA